MKLVCVTSHPQISSGVCPWCLETIGDQSALQDAAKTVWNSNALLATLNDADEGGRIITVTNLGRNGPPIDIAVPLFSIALTDDSDQIRASAEHRLSQLGNNLSPEAARRFEDHVSGSPYELALRILLLEYYQRRQFDSESAEELRNEHVFWMIENAAERAIAGSPSTFILDHRGRESYSRAKELWLRQIDLHPENTRILGNASQFFLLYDPELSEELLQHAAAREPNNSAWPKRLAQLYNLQSRGKSSDRQINLEKAFRAHQIAEHLQHAASETPKNAMLIPLQRELQLTNLARSALEAGHLEEARNYATELLNMVSSHPSATKFKGNSIHHGNLVLGRIALKKGDVEQAKEHLLAAGKTCGSPQLNSFGPNMMLAKELLEQGERDVVLEYFHLIGSFWIHHSETLDEWANDVSAGTIPNFGANLVY